MRQAEPAEAARWLFRTVAGDAPGPARRVVAGAAVSLLIVVLTASVLAAVLGSLAIVASLFGGIATPTPRPDRTTIAWPLVVVTTVALVGTATAVSWTSARRGRADGSAIEADPVGAEAPGHDASAPPGPDPSPPPERS